MSRPMTPIHDCDEYRAGPIAKARGQRGYRHLKIRGSPVVAALIVAALAVVLPTSTPIAEAKKAFLKPVAKNQNPVVNSLVNFVRPSNGRTKTKVVNINDLGAAQDSVEPSMRQESESVATKKTQIKVVQPEQKKKVLLLPLQSTEKTEQQEFQEGLMGQTESGASSQSGYADDTPGIFLPLPSKQSPTELRQAETEEIPKETLFVTTDDTEEERKRVVKEFHKYTMGEEDTPSTAEAAPEEVDEVTAVYYYLPENTGTTGPGDPPVPSVVYDKGGKKLSLLDLHKAGDEVYMEHPEVSLQTEEVAMQATEEESEFNPKTSSVESPANVSSTERKMNAISGHSDDMPQAQDQMIIISTVATMALLVGALSARRLRSRQFLSSCIENESLEDDVAYDAAYTHNATPGGSMAGGGFRQHPQLHHRIRGGDSGEGLMGGAPGTGLMADVAVGYDTFASPGSGHPPPWKGDLEKFDV